MKKEKIDGRVTRGTGERCALGWFYRLGSQEPGESEDKRDGVGYGYEDLRVGFLE